VLLSTGSTVFSRFGTIDRARQAVTLVFPLDAERLRAPRSGRTLFDIVVRPDTGSLLSLGAVRISRDDGASVLRALPRSGDLLIALRPGDSALKVRGRGASTGAFVVSVHLMGDVNGDGAVQPSDLALIRSGSPDSGGARAVRLARRNLGAATLAPAITFHVVNDTKPKGNLGAPPAYPSAQIYVAITGQDAATVQFVHLDRNGDAVPMQLSDNTAPNHLTKGGINYSNYFFTLDQVSNGWDVPYNLTGARLWVGLGSPVYFQVNTDANGRIGYTTPNLSNPTDPNIDLYWDHTEFATVDRGINANTTQVDQFGFPQLMTLKAAGMPDQIVGINASRSALPAAYQQGVPGDFQPPPHRPSALPGDRPEARCVLPEQQSHLFRQLHQRGLDALPGHALDLHQHPRQLLRHGRPRHKRAESHPSRRPERADLPREQAPDLGDLCRSRQHEDRQCG
jgi:hypothetical protein